jgi:hypothetical protein
LIALDAALAEDVLRHANRRHGVPPSGVEREMCDELGDLRRLDAVVERQVDVVRHLDRVVARDERGERNDAAVPGSEAGPFPYLAE